MKKTYNELKEELAELKLKDAARNLVDVLKDTSETLRKPDIAPCDEYEKITRNLIWGSIIILGLLILFAGLESLVDANRVQTIVITTRTIGG